MGGNTLNMLLDDGIRSVFVTYGYSGTFNVNNDTNFDWNDIKSQVDQKIQPF
jgi:hypothetical protein